MTAGDVGILPGGAPMPDASTIILGPGQTRANNALVTLGDGAFVVENDASGTVHLIVDVKGNFDTVPVARPTKRRRLWLRPASQFSTIGLTVEVRGEGRSGGRRERRSVSTTWPAGSRSGALACTGAKASGDVLANTICKWNRSVTVFGGPTSKPGSREGNCGNQLPDRVETGFSRGWNSTRGGRDNLVDRERPAYPQPTRCQSSS